MLGCCSWRVIQHFYGQDAQERMDLTAGVTAHARERMCCLGAKTRAVTVAVGAGVQFEHVGQQPELLTHVVKSLFHRWQRGVMGDGRDWVACLSASATHSASGRCGSEGEWAASTSVS